MLQRFLGLTTPISKNPLKGISYESNKVALHHDVTHLYFYIVKESQLYDCQCQEEFLWFLLQNTPIRRRLNDLSETTVDLETV